LKEDIMFKRKPQKGIPRELALVCRPEKVDPIRTTEVENGKLRVTVLVSPPKWISWFNRRKEIERTYGLDSLGREVYEACDGKRRVKDIIAEFARSHKISHAEAEISVTSFLKTLVAKGIVYMALENAAFEKSARKRKH